MYRQHLAQPAALRAAGSLLLLQLQMVPDQVVGHLKFVDGRSNCVIKL